LFAHTRVSSAAEHATESSSSAEELCEEVFGGHSATGTALLKAFLAILVVYLALLGI
jgi:hypothetical protein